MFRGGLNMINIFTRREIVVTLDVARQSDICSILAANGIQYKVIATDLQSASTFGSSRARTGTFGINQNYSYEYKIYVHKNDYENALRLIG